MPKRNVTLKCCLLLAFGLICLLFLLGGSLAVKAKTITVDQGGSGDYETIQEAVDNASTGDEIRVWAGTYEENVVLDKTLSLIGNGSESTTIDGKEQDNTVLIDAEDCKLGGFQVIGGKRLVRGGGICVEEENTRIFDMNCSGNAGSGIFLLSADHSIVQNTTIWNNGRSGIGVGIGFQACEDLSFYSNTFIDEGIFISGLFSEEWDSHTIPENNTVNGKSIRYFKDLSDTILPSVDGPIILAGCFNVTVKDQNLSDHWIGLLVGHSSKTQILNSTFYNNTDHGIFLDDSRNTLISNVICSGNLEDGIEVRNSFNCSILDSRILNNGKRGVDLSASFYSTISGISAQNNTLEGIAFSATSYGTIVDTRCLDNGKDGFELLGADHIVISNCVSANNGGSGFFLNSFYSSIIENTTVDDHNYGITVYSTEDSCFQNNSIIGNNYGISVDDMSENISAHNNSFLDNWHTGLDLSKSSDSQLNATMNWWGHNSGPYHSEHNSKGKGDTVSGDVLFDPWIRKSEPKAVIFPFSSNQTRRWRTVLFNASSSSAEDGEIVRYSWSSNSTGSLYNGSEDSVRLYMELGNHTITLRVQDDDGLWSDPVTTELDVWENPKGELKVSNVGLYLGKGESSSCTFKASQHDSILLNLSLVNYNESDTRDRVVLLYSELEEVIGDDINWNIDFLNPVGGKEQVFYTFNYNLDYYKFVVPGNGNETLVQLKIDHFFFAENDDRDLARFRLRGFDYLLEEEPEHPRDLEKMLELQMTSKRVFDYNLTYLLEENLHPTLDYDGEVKMELGIEGSMPPRIVVNDAIPVVAGESFNLSVVLIGQSREDDYQFTVELEGETGPHWVIYSSNYVLGSDLSIDKEEEILIYLEITPDRDWKKVPGGEKYELKIKVQSRDTPSKQNYEYVEIYVPIRYIPGIDVVGTAHKIVVVDGGPTTFQFNLSNDGSVMDQIELSCVVAGREGRAGPTDAYWTKVFSPSSPVEVGPGEMVPVYLNLSPVLDNRKIPPGLYEIFVNATSLNRESARASACLYLEMPDFYKPHCQLVSRPPDANIQIGTEGVYRFKVTNAGWVSEPFTLEFTITDTDGNVVSQVDGLAGWTYSMEDFDTGLEISQDRVYLDYGISQDVLLRLTPPAGLDEGDYTLEFIMISSGPAQETAVVTDTFSLTLPDLWIETVDIVLTPDPVTEGEVIIISATIHWVGSFDGPVTVGFYYRPVLANELIEAREITLPDVGGDAGVTIECSWKAVLPDELFADELDVHSMVVDIVVVLDPGNAVEELDEDNNGATSQLTILKKDSDEGGFLPGFELTGLLSGLGVACFALKKKRRFSK